MIRLADEFSAKSRGRDAERWVENRERIAEEHAGLADFYISLRRFEEAARFAKWAERLRATGRAEQAVRLL